jgi:hypothetical protein
MCVYSGEEGSQDHMASMNSAKSFSTFSRNLLPSGQVGADLSVLDDEMPENLRPALQIAKKMIGKSEN